MMEHYNVVYKISFNYDVSYTSQIKKKVKTRIKEHEMNIKKSNDSHTVVSENQLEYGHKLD